MFQKCGAYRARGGEEEGEEEEEEEEEEKGEEEVVVEFNGGGGCEEEGCGKSSGTYGCLASAVAKTTFP
jgi:hypothetical protein